MQGVGCRVQGAECRVEGGGCRHLGDEEQEVVLFGRGVRLLALQLCGRLQLRCLTHT